MTQEWKPGPIVLFGSGETSASGRKIFDRVMSALPLSPEIALLETPAGFELNSAQVIGRVGEFLRLRLQNYNPQTQIIPARKRGTPFSPDDAEIAEPLLSVDMIFMGPGSPTYAVRQLIDSITWQYLLARHCTGGTLVLASAATVAVSAYTLPVYEIYKVGEDLHWINGLDFFRRCGLPLVFIPHWNNNDGGQELDTSCCFMGKQRFLALLAMLPPEAIIVGIDEKTALIFDSQSGKCEVVGIGKVSLIYSSAVHGACFSEQQAHTVGMIGEKLPEKSIYSFNHGQSFTFNRFPSFHQSEAGEGIPGDVWAHAIDIHKSRQAREPILEKGIHPPDEIIELAQQRQIARQNKEWQLADKIRDQISFSGWVVIDTPEGPRFEAASRRKA